MNDPPNWQAVICDLDGCLANEKGGAMDLVRLGRIAEHNRRVEAAGEGPTVTVCTGRPQPFAEAMCRLLANNTLPCIAENGVWLYHPGTNHYERDPAITPDHADAVVAASKLLNERYAGRGVTQQPGKTSSVTLFHPDRQVLIDIQPEVRDLLAQRDWPFRVSMTWDYINCDLKHVSKSTGLARLFQRTGLDPGRCLGLGDTMSDLPIAEACGWFGCPANAADEIKQHADYVSPEEEVAGVLDILRQAGALRGPG
ncbi:HAD family hydrolase [Botrimarina sp.]|uniref:HAD family hydrolase n=1 Tax=Botrimarina sp. TaxID=2795802 RepID=UPI0032EB914A